MKQLPDEQTRAELLDLGKSLEAQARKVYLMAEGLAQKYEHKLPLLQQTNERQEIPDEEISTPTQSS